MSALLLLAVAVLVALNGFFVAAEFALVRARRSRVEALATAGARSAGLALRQIDRIDEYLSACQLGITMASLGIGFLGEPAIAELLEEPLGSTFSHGVAITIAITISYLIVTAAHITVGEQVPKIFAITHAEGTALVVAAPLEWFRVLSRPLIWVLNSASNAMLRAIGTDPRADLTGSASIDEFRLLISESERGGKLDRGEASMLSGVFHLHEQKARQIMTPLSLSRHRLRRRQRRDGAPSLHRFGPHPPCPFSTATRSTRPRGSFTQTRSPGFSWSVGRRQVSAPLSRRPSSSPSQNRSTTSSPTCKESVRRWPSSPTSTAAPSAS